MDADYDVYVKVAAGSQATRLDGWEHFNAEGLGDAEESSCSDGFGIAYTDGFGIAYTDGFGTAYSGRGRWVRRRCVAS